jgi:hypothetical protein
LKLNVHILMNSTTYLLHCPQGPLGVYETYELAFHAAQAAHNKGQAGWTTHSKSYSITPVKLNGQASRLLPETSLAPNPTTQILEQTP